MPRLQPPAAAQSAPALQYLPHLQRGKDEMEAAGLSARWAAAGLVAQHMQHLLLDTAARRAEKARRQQSRRSRQAQRAAQQAQREQQAQQAHQVPLARCSSQDSSLQVEAKTI